MLKRRRNWRRRDRGLCRWICDGRARGYSRLDGGWGAGRGRLRAFPGCGGRRRDRTGWRRLRRGQGPFESGPGGGGRHHRDGISPRRDGRLPLIEGGSHARRGGGGTPPIGQSFRRHDVGRVIPRCRQRGNRRGRSVKRNRARSGKHRGQSRACSGNGRRQPGPRGCGRAVRDRRSRGSGLCRGGGLLCERRGEPGHGVRGKVLIAGARGREEGMAIRRRGRAARRLRQDRGKPRVCGRCRVIFLRGRFIRCSAAMIRAGGVRGTGGCHRLRFRRNRDKTRILQRGQRPGQEVGRRCARHRRPLGKLRVETEHTPRSQLSPLRRARAGRRGEGNKKGQRCLRLHWMPQNSSGLAAPWRRELTKSLLPPGILAAD